jgi:DNA sulfur modification protein DndB
MSNKTFIPAFECKVGDWKYYIAMMKYGEVARQVNFAFELSRNAELGQLVQRGLSARTKDITEYLLRSEHRFLGALVVAAWGGEPAYTRLAMDDPDGILRGIDREFGVLTFDGSQQYFALDGQHRLRAIKDALKQNPALAIEDICVLLVTHYDTPDGRIRTRRLFSNINRNAVKTAAAEDIVLDEDDGFAVIVRRLLDEHAFFKVEGRVKVKTIVGANGEMKLAGNSVPKSDPRAFTTLPVLYDVIQYLGWDLPSEVRRRKARPDPDILESSYKKVSERLDGLLAHCGDIGSKMSNAVDARDLRGRTPHESEGHPFMRPVIQKAVARVLGEIVAQGQLSWTDVLARAAMLDWKLGSHPWTAVFSPSARRMLTGKDNVDVLIQLLHSHLAPASIASIKRARKAFRDVLGVGYPVSEEELQKSISGVAPVPELPALLPVEELSEVAQQELAAIPPEDSEPE